MIILNIPLFKGLTLEQIEDMKNENVDMPNQGVNGFDFEWKD